MAGVGGGMANPGRDRPHGVSSGLSSFNMAASDPKNLYEPPSTIRPVWGHCPPEGHAGVGGKGPALHVCTGPEGSGGQRMHIRPQGSGYFGVDPPPAVGQAVENFKAAVDSPGQRQLGGPDLLRLMAESCSGAGEWKVYAAAVLSFATLCRVGEISSLRRSNISKVGITYQGVKRDHR